MWPSSQRIGKVIRASSYFSNRRVVDLVPEACSTAMTKDRHGELAVIDLSMIAIALTPSWLVRILEVMPGYIFHHPCFFLFCFWTRPKGSRFSSWGLLHCDDQRSPWWTSRDRLKHDRNRSDTVMISTNFRSYARLYFSSSLFFSVLFLNTKLYILYKC